VEFIPKFLAQKFSYFESISVPKFFLLFFGSGAVLMIVSTFGEFFATVLAPILASLIFLAFAGIASAQHYARKPYIPTSPLIVQFTSKAWFNTILSVLSCIRHWGVILFIHLVVFMVVLVNGFSIMQLIGS
jgi:hypothetical protein